MIFLAGLTIPKKKRCLGIVSGCRGDYVVALHLMNAVDYCLPIFRPHGTQLGHSWYEWIIKVIFLAGLTILKKKRCLGRLSGWGVDPVVALHLRNAADYLLSYFWTTWPQTRAFLISVNNKKWFFWLVWQLLKKVSCLGIVSGRRGDPVVALRLRNATDNRIPTFGPHGTKLGHSWYQWIIKNYFSGWFDNS